MVVVVPDLVVVPDCLVVVGAVVVVVELVLPVVLVVLVVGEDERELRSTSVRSCAALRMVTPERFAEFVTRRSKELSGCCV